MARPQEIGHRIQANIYNTNLPEINDNITTITTQTDFDSTPKSDTIAHDGYHITEKGADIITKIIQDTLQPENENTQQENEVTRPKTTTKTISRRSPKPDNINTKMINIETTKIGILMGKEGRTQRRIERRHDIGVHIDHKINTDNTQTITLRGEKNNTEAAMKDILNIIDTITEEPQQKQRKYKTPCRYFERGNCRKGDSCEFYHDNTSSRQQRKRPHSQERHRTSPYRQRSQSRTRYNPEQTHRQDQRQHNNRTQHDDREEYRTPHNRKYNR